VTLRNCVRCGALFGSHGGQRLCPACVKQEQADFEAVRDYLKSRPGAPLLEVSDATGVSVARIREWVREGRLVLQEPGANGLVCERCGRPVSTGRLCDRCRRELALQLQSGMERGKSDRGEEPEKDSPPSSTRSGLAGKGKVHLADRLRRKIE